MLLCIYSYASSCLLATGGRYRKQFPEERPPTGQQGEEN